MAAPPRPYQLFVGIDIAALRVTAAWQGAVSQRPTPAVSKPRTFEQPPDGFSQLDHAIRALGVAPAQTLVVMEATGAYWLSLATYLVRHGYAVSRINPLQAHHFAKALLKRAKTDAIDAQTLTQLAAVLQPAPWTPPPALYDEIYQRLTHRDALLTWRNQVRNQLHARAQYPMVVVSVRDRLCALDRSLSEAIAAVEEELRQVVRPVAGDADPLAGDDAQAEAQWVVTIERLQTIPGVGLITALWVVVSTLNFTICANAEQAAAYAGLAPMPRQSGTSVQKRPWIGHSGNGRLRRARYLATLSGARFNPPLKIFYDRLIDNGKPKKVARCAAARKLLHIAWAVGKKGHDFNPLHGLAAA